MFRYVVAVSLSLLMLNDVARAKSVGPPLCPGGRFVAATPLVAGDGAPEAAAVVLAGGQVTVGGRCAATTAAVTRTRHGTLVRARWQTCSGVRGPVRLRGMIRTGCATLVGVIRARHHQRHFVASRQPECGNGIREGQEQCDGGPCCTSTCQLASDPGCPGAHACTTDADCARGSAGGAFCARPAGQCAGAGVCQATPIACTATVDPVCGCDGQTFPNACTAAEHGVNVAAPGACGAPPCGTSAGPGCPDSQFCEEGPGQCGVPDAAGRCLAVPATCLGILDPVCGCDGNTYINDCFRLQAKVEKAREGLCGCPEILCAPGTKPIDTNGDGCPDRCLVPCDTPCDCLKNPTTLPPGLPCPLACTADGQCGGFWTCQDHVCVAQCGPIPADPCPPPPPCQSDGDCASDSAQGAFCETPAGQCAGPGTCTPRPAVCPQFFAPVCGCDGQTYGNACDAAGHGANVAHDGPCTSTAGCFDTIANRCTGQVCGPTQPCLPNEFCVGTCPPPPPTGKCFVTVDEQCSETPCGPGQPCRNPNEFCSPACLSSTTTTTSTTLPPPCTTDAQCNDGNPCTTDHCVNGMCEHACVCVDATGAPSCCPGPAALCARPCGKDANGICGGVCSEPNEVCASSGTICACTPVRPPCSADAGGMCGGNCPPGATCESLPTATCRCVSGLGGPCGGFVLPPPPVCGPGLLCQQINPDLPGVCVQATP